MNDQPFSTDPHAYCERCKDSLADVVLVGSFSLCWKCYAKESRTQPSTVWRPRDYSNSASGN